MSNLVPQEAYDAACDARKDFTYETLKGAVDAAAPLIVALSLRRVLRESTHLLSKSTLRFTFMDYLQKEINILDPEGLTRQKYSRYAPELPNWKA